MPQMKYTDTVMNSEPKKWINMNAKYTKCVNIKRSLSTTITMNNNMLFICHIMYTIIYYNANMPSSLAVYVIRKKLVYGDNMFVGKISFITLAKLKILNC